MNFLDPIKDFCAEIGEDRLLVQGAGGNISVKEKNILWVKASGTWIADAKTKQIFTAVDLDQLNSALQNYQYDVLPQTLGEDALRPSIETLLHAVMPQKIVLHLHAIEVLAYLVQTNAQESLGQIFGESISWKFIQYTKPGADLARVVHMALNSSINTNVLFLENHGVVIGANTLEEVMRVLNSIRKMLNREQKNFANHVFMNAIESSHQNTNIKGYVKCSDADLNELATIPSLMNMVEFAWALYPDHVVFLGPKPIVVEIENVSSLDFQKGYKPPFIFVKEFGVFEIEYVTKAQKAQLRCYHDVLIRLQSPENLKVLSQQQIQELLNWDAEKYRLGNAV